MISAAAHKCSVSPDCYLAVAGKNKDWLYFGHVAAILGELGLTPLPRREREEARNKMCLCVTSLCLGVFIYDSAQARVHVYVCKCV